MDAVGKGDVLCVALRLATHLLTSALHRTHVSSLRTRRRPPVRLQRTYSAPPHHQPNESRHISPTRPHISSLPHAATRQQSKRVESTERKKKRRRRKRNGTTRPLFSFLVVSFMPSVINATRLPLQRCGCQMGLKHIGSWHLIIVVLLLFWYIVVVGGFGYRGDLGLGSRMSASVRHIPRCSACEYEGQLRCLALRRAAWRPLPPPHV
ncbi:uncharacterized protein J3D65DRAFT_628985 [Phyllosticta citribraziliensis]|uniref:Uncharacterized protein n=1 Tax=Phyllosticta citribraziliensis TaxID=989973 RepID=A0ABR1LJ79_9PEZI